MERLKDGETLPFKVPSLESEKYLWSMEGVALELTHNWGTEVDPNYVPNNGNIEPHRGFGHIAFNVDDVEAYSNELLADGVEFKKKPSEGRMRNIAFVYDPDHYWIELVPRTPGLDYGAKCTFSQTMIRVKDVKKALDFYCGTLGMHLMRVSHQSDFSLYFLANPHRDGQSNLSEAESQIDELSDQLPNYYPLDKDGNAAKAVSDEAKHLVHSLARPVLELTHNHGTEEDEKFSYHNGNDAPAGFGHIGFIVDNLEESCRKFEEKGITFRKKPDVGMKGLAFILDDNKYSVEIIQRGITFGEENWKDHEKIFREGPPVVDKQ